MPKFLGGWHVALLSPPLTTTHDVFTAHPLPLITHHSTFRRVNGSTGPFYRRRYGP